VAKKVLEKYFAKKSGLGNEDSKKGQASVQ
jgi:hypothetical protein